MEKENIIKDILQIITDEKLIKITFSNFRDKSIELTKVYAKLLIAKKEVHIQFEYRYARILEHKNFNVKNVDDIKNELETLFLNARDINVQTENENINIKISKKHKLAINRKKENNNLIITSQNKKKNYLLEEKTKYEFLVELGIQTTDGKIKKDKYNKFKQINI